MLVATCNRLFQIGSETRTIEIDDSIVRRYASDTERDRESYTEVCDVCLSRPIILDVQVCGRLMDDRRHADPSTGALGPGKGTYGSSSLYVGDQYRRIFLRSAKSVAARVEREHQWPAETVLSEGHRLVGASASLSEQSGSPAKRTTT